MHQFRVRIMTSPTFTSARIIGAILFEATMDGLVQGKVRARVPLERPCGIVPFLKVDKGLEVVSSGVRLMKEPDSSRCWSVRSMGIFERRWSVIDANVAQVSLGGSAPAVRRRRADYCRGDDAYSGA